MNTNFQKVPGESNRNYLKRWLVESLQFTVGRKLTTPVCEEIGRTAEHVVAAWSKACGYYRDLPIVSSVISPDLKNVKFYFQDSAGRPYQWPQGME